MVAKVLLALADLGLAMPLQETLEGAGHVVGYDAAATQGPSPEKTLPDIVIFDASLDTLLEAATAWRAAEPPPTIMAAGPAHEAVAAAMSANVEALDTATDDQNLLATIDRALAFRFAGRMAPSYARGALGIASAAQDETADELQIIRRNRDAPLHIVRESLKPYVAYYLTGLDKIAMLREHRALQIPEVELTKRMDGTKTLRSLLGCGVLSREHAGQLIWALLSINAARVDPDPPDVETSGRRAITEFRRHLRARQVRLVRACYYDVLEVTPGAPPEEVDMAARILAIRYSPVRASKLDLSDMGSLARKNWDQIMRARRTLFDPYERARYNDAVREKADQLQSPWVFDIVDSSAAEAAYRRGQEALVQGEVFKAVSAMATACRSHPVHPDYEASLAWARYRAEIARGGDRSETAAKERASAEETLAGKRPWPRALVALAMLCSACEDPGAARWHLREALQVNPNLPIARKLLQRLGNG